MDPITNGNWERIKVFQLGLHIEKLKQCPCFENAKMSTFKTRVGKRVLAGKRLLSANCIIFTKRQFEIKTLSSKMLKKKKKNC